MGEDVSDEQRSLAAEGERRLRVVQHIAQAARGAFVPPPSGSPTPPSGGFSGKLDGCISPDLPAQRGRSCVTQEPPVEPGGNDYCELVAGTPGKGTHLRRVLASYPQWKVFTVPEQLRVRPPKPQGLPNKVQ